MQFSKYVGCGNDFILIDNRIPAFPTQDPNLISKLCHRQLGIGADGIILLENSSEADFRMRIFNADGSEAEMCGNGIRCLLKFIHELEFQDPSYLIETMESRIRVTLEDGDVKVEMPSPYEIRWDIPLQIHDTKYTLHHLNTGVPHAVIFSDNIDNVSLNFVGREIRFHPIFNPRGANVNFAACRQDGVVVRTYERGVEQETLACGTGATATALAAAKVYGLPSPISVKTRSGEVLKIGFNIKDEAFDQVTLTGPATLVYRGVFASADFCGKKNSVCLY